MATIEQQLASPVALMVDIETLSLRPDAFVTQVGICVTNTETREYLKPPTNYWMSDVWQQDRRIDFSTVRWWMAQDRTVAAGVFNAPPRPDGREDRVSPRELFHVIETTVKTYEGITVWGSPAMFDLPVLTSLWGGEKPWKYNFERCMMTLYKLIDPTGALQPPENGKGHDAATDAHWQMEYLLNLLEKLRAHA